MKFWISSEKSNTIAVSVGGKTYAVAKDEKAGGRPLIEIPNDANLPFADLEHLVTLGWQIADDGTARYIKDVLKAVLKDGQLVLDETAKKAFLIKP